MHRIAQEILNGLFGITIFWNLITFLTSKWIVSYKKRLREAKRASHWQINFPQLIEGSLEKKER